MNFNRDSGGDPSDRVNGFFRTSEGREFLRVVYRRYLARVQSEDRIVRFGDSKIASMIADDNRADQTGENRLTRAALRRWADEGQSELWSKDHDKTLRVMQRLELQFMLEPEIAEILDDRSVTIRRNDAANAFANFFHGANTSSNFALRNNLKEYEGVFELIPIQGIDTQNDYYSYYKTYWRMEVSKTNAFLLVQEFTLSPRKNDSSRIFIARYGGFIYVRPNKALIRLMISHHDKETRWIESFSRVEIKYLPKIESGYFEKDDLIFKVEYLPASVSSLELTAVNSSYYVNDAILRRATGDTAKFINKQLAGIMWDIPL